MELVPHNQHFQLDQHPLRCRFCTSTERKNLSRTLGHMRAFSSLSIVSSSLVPSLGTRLVSRYSGPAIRVTHLDISLSENHQTPVSTKQNLNRPWLLLAPLCLHADSVSLKLFLLLHTQHCSTKKSIMQARSLPRQM